MCADSYYENLSATTDSELICQVCHFAITPDSRRTCNHICIACEVTFLQCPICTLTERGSAISSESVKGTACQILEAQVPSGDRIVPGTHFQGNYEVQQSTKPPKSANEQIVKHCFLGIWDTVIDSILGTIVTRKALRKNMLIRNFHRTVARICRQTGRTLFLNFLKSMSSSTAFKYFGGIAVLILGINLVVIQKRVK